MLSLIVERYVRRGLFRTRVVMSTDEERVRPPIVVAAHQSHIFVTALANVAGPPAEGMVVRIEDARGNRHSRTLRLDIETGRPLTGRVIARWVQRRRAAHRRRLLLRIEKSQRDRS